ncbi:MAG: hypothetical protein EOP51_15990, partial [Sphingobacteriales bacterium]
MSAGDYASSYSFIGAWIDFNQNGVFETSEKLGEITATSVFPATYSIPFSVPAGAVLGATRLRVRYSYDDENMLSCSGGSYGETEDYNINILPAPACASVTNVSAGSVTATAAQITWDCPGCTGTFIVEYGPAATFTSPGTGTTAGTGGTIASTAATLPFSLTGLTGNTEYMVYVRQNCGANGFSSNSIAATFTTPCVAITSLPFTESFEDTSPTLACWTVIDGNTDGYQWALSTSFPRTGSQSAVMYTDASSSNNDYLIMPQITLPANHQLRFWVRARSTGEPDEIAVKVSTTGNTIADFTATALASTPVATTTYTEYVVDLSAYTGNVFIAFVRAAAPANGWNLYLDDVTVQQIPTCASPTAFSTSNVTSGAVQLNFTSAATSFVVEYGPSASFTTPGTGATAGAGGTVITTVTGSPYTVTGLTSGTAYRFFVRANCGANGYSANAGPVTATTVPTCPSGLGAGLNAIASLPYSGTGLTTCGNGDNVTAANTNSLTCGSTNYLGGEDATHVFTPATSGQVIITFNSTATWTGIMLYSACPFGGSGATCVGSNTSSSSGTKTITANLTGGQTYYLVVDTYPSPTCISSYSLDISAPITCAAPSAFSSSNVTTSAVQLNFTNNGGGGTFIVEYGPSASFTTPGAGATAGTGGTVITGLTGSPYTVTGLANSTNYRFFVRQDCGGGDFSSNTSGITANTLSPPPANDNCAGAIALTVYGSGACVATNGTTAGATQSLSGCAGTADDDVWYTFTATQTTQIVTVIGGSSFDAVLQVLTACGGTSLACKDDTGSGSAETTTLTGLTVGNTYAIRVYHYSSSVSSAPTFTICVTEPATPPANDNCANAISLPVNAFGSCVPVTGTTLAATQSIAGCSGNANDDVWYSFVATHTSHIITVDGESGFDAEVNVRSGSCNGTSMVCQDNTGSGGVETITATGLTIGNTYLVRVYHYASTVPSNSNFTICVTAPNCSSTTVAASNNSPVIYNGTIMLSVASASSYTWSGPNGFSSNLQNPQISNATPVDAGIYTVSGVANSGCSYMSTTTVSVGSTFFMTIDQTQPTAGTNFASFTDAASYLNGTGVSTATQIDVVSGTGPYNEQLLLNTIPGSSAVNTVTINGNGNVLSLCSNNSTIRDVVRLNGTDNISISGLVIEASCG